MSKGVLAVCEKLRLPVGPCVVDVREEGRDLRASALRKSLDFEGQTMNSRAKSTDFGPKSMDFGL